MSDVSKFNVMGEIVNVKDTSARSSLATLRTDTNNKINAINNRLDHEEITLLVGDSYGNGYTPEGQIEGWTVRLARLLTGRVLHKSVNGAGFLAKGDGGATFQSILTDLRRQITNADIPYVSRIIIGGGFNDQFGDVSDIVSSITRFSNYAKSTFPKAKISILVLGWGANPGQRTNIYNTVFNAYYNGASRNGLGYCEDCCYALHDYSRFSSDGFHPNSAGMNALTFAINSYIANNRCDVSFAWRPLPINVIAAQVGTPEQNFVGVSIADGMTYITAITTQFNNIPKATFRGGEFVKIGTFSKGILGGYNTQTPFCSIYCNLWLRNEYTAGSATARDFYTVNAYLVFDYQGNSVHLYIPDTQPDHKGYFLLNNVIEMRLQGGSVVLPNYLT